MPGVRNTSGRLRAADRLSLLRFYNALEAEPAGAFDDAVALAARVCDANAASLSFCDAQRQWLKARVGLDATEAPLEGSLVAHALRKNENIFIVEDIAADARFALDPIVQADPGLRFYAGALVATPDGAAIGVLSVYGSSPRPDGLDKGQTNALLALAGGAMRELERRRAPAQAPAPAAGDAISPSLAREMSGAQMRKALLLTKTIPWEISVPAERITLGDNARDLIGVGSSLAVSKFRDHIHEEDQPLFDGALREAMSGSPGEIDVRFRRTRGRQAWLRMRAEMLSHFAVAGTFVDITAERQRETDSATPPLDHLTGVASRAAFQDDLQKQLKRARLRQKKLAVLFVDIDDLEDVNGAYGHHAGDAVLREAAGRLMRLVGSRGLVGRARDDEFVISLRDVVSPGAVEEFGASLVEELRRPFAFEGNELTATASIGAAVFPDHHRDQPRLLQAADAALKVAKSSGRDRMRMFAPQDTREAETRMRERQALRVGIARNDLLAFYQPVFDLQSGEVVALEALARWRHPSKGVLAANYFQSAFENTQTATEITDSMLRSIAEDRRMWSGEGFSGLRVSLNLAECELRRRDIAERILAAIEAGGGPSSLLEIEAPETAFARSDSATISAIDALKSAGVRIALDNFGKTSGAMSILRAVAFDHLKIDRGLVAGVENDANGAIVAAAITLAQRMNMDVTAEGVETIPQLEKLRAMGCANVQGFLLGAPMSAARVPEFIRRLRDARAAQDAAYSMLEEPDPFGPARRPVQ